MLDLPLYPDRINFFGYYFFLTSQADEISQVIAELEKSIARYKEEYAALISQAQAIKADLAAVEAKVSLIYILVQRAGVTGKYYTTHYSSTHPHLIGTS